MSKIDKNYEKYTVALCLITFFLTEELVAAVFDEFKGLLKDLVKTYPICIYSMLIMAYLCVLTIMAVVILACLFVIFIIVIKIHEYLFPPDPNAPRRNADGRWYNPRTGRFI
jgi:hypothetical protein